MAQSTCPGCVVREYEVAVSVVSGGTMQQHQNSNTNTKLDLNRSNHSDDEATTILLCPSCIHASLNHAKERHHLAKETWYEARTKCKDYFQRKQQSGRRGKNLDYYNHRYHSLRDKLQELQQSCRTVTMETCALNLKIIERQEQIASMNRNSTHMQEERTSAEQCRQVLSQLQQSLCGYSDSSNNDSKDIDSNDNCTEDNKADSVTADHSIKRTTTKTPTSANGGALIHHIQHGKHVVQSLRFHWALQAFTIFRLQIDKEDLYHHNNGDMPSTTTSIKNKDMSEQQKLNTKRKKKNTVSGIGKICGLPLPHAGFELYGVLPHEELQSALRLVAQLTYMISRCLNITLPHPICLLPKSSSFSTTSSLFAHDDDGDIANVIYHRNATATTEGVQPTNSITSSITSLLGGGAGGLDIRPMTTAIGSTSDPATNILSSFHHQQYHHQQLLLQMDTKHVEQRIRYATCAILAEDHQSTTTYYKLSTSKGTMSSMNSKNTNVVNGQLTDDSITTKIAGNGVGILQSHPKAQSNESNNNITSTNSSSSNGNNDEEFMIALQLLQNNIFVLCRSIGVPIDTLYPGEAILLNLYTIQLLCSSPRK